MFKIGIDVGGTFTDFVVAQDGEAPRYFKSPSTPDDPSGAVMTGLAEAASEYGLTVGDLLHDTDLIIHGTTVATNTLVERKGARVGLITTEGFRDVLEMRDGLKEDRYNLHLNPIQPLVPPIPSARGSGASEVGRVGRDIARRGVSGPGARYAGGRGDRRADGVPAVSRISVPSTNAGSAT